jgi:cytochrome c peroxidase
MPPGASLFTIAGPLCALCLTLLPACGGGGGSSSEAKSDLSPAAQLGQKIFFDTSLSASGRLSCATCHNPATGHAGNDGLAVPMGGPLMVTPGFRNAPSLRYLSTTPAFFFDGEGTPTGGFDRDGRANDLAAQAERPFLAAHEMDNVDHASVIDKLARAAYIADFRSLFGADILRDVDTAFARVQFALAQYAKEDPVFHSFDSKYDFFLAGKAALTAQELRGLALYNAAEKGNCAACHPSSRSGGAPPLFTDFTYDNLGVPRNEAIAANADPAYYDLGLCGPFRTDLAARTDLCGAFKVPSLRNVAITGPYFHNGRFANLTDLVRFYVRRDTNPEEWYPVGADGSIVKFNDLPPEYRGNVNVTEVPYNRKPGDAPALNDQEIGDLVAFLGTLTDGYRP